MQKSEYNITIPICDNKSVVFNTYNSEFKFLENNSGTPQNIFSDINYNFESYTEFIKEDINRKSSRRRLTIIPTTICNARCWFCPDFVNAYPKIHQQTMERYVDVVS